MRRSRILPVVWLGLLAVGAAAVAHAQSTGRPVSGIARTADGRPDFEGVWNLATVTPLQRPDRFAGRPFMTDEEAKAFERQASRAAEGGRGDQNGMVGLNGPPINEFWMERGGLAIIAGRAPTSLVVDPADGRIPPLTAEAQARLRRRAASRGRFDSHADFSLSERCLRSASGPPYLAGAPDANLIRITQAPDYIAIVQEKFHETRVIALNGGPRRSPAIRTWTGESLARWDGDTLVVETAGFPRQLLLGNRFDDNLRFVERFSLLGPRELIYEFMVDNPTAFTAPWTVRLPMTRTGDELFEFACHEGNYSLPNILRGARFEERASTTGR